MIIEVFQDLICPWCRIGTQNLNEALKKWEGDPIIVQYRAFLLNPSTPDGGITFKDYMKAKGAEHVKYEDFVQPIIAAGDKVGLNFNLDELGKIANTIIGHRFLYIIPDKNKSEALDLLHTAYFENGRDIGNLEVLLDIAKHLNLDTEIIRNQLEGEAGKEETLMDFYYAIQVGITGVPMFIFDNKAVLAGAQSAENILETMKKAELIAHPVIEGTDTEVMN